MPLPRSPEGAVEINRECNPRRTRPLTRLSPAPRRGAGHPSRLVSSPPAFSRAPAGRRGEEGYAHQPGVTPPAISLTPLPGVPPLPFAKGGQAFQTASLSHHLSQGYTTNRRSGSAPSLFET